MPTVKPTGEKMPHLIERDIPIPPPRQMSGIFKIFRQLKVGESVWLAVTQDLGCTYAGRIIGKGNYRSRKERHGVRIWRVG